MSVSASLRRVLRRVVQRVAPVAINVLATILRGHQSHATGDPPAHVVVIRLDLLGDVLFTMPLIHALRKRYPQAHLTMVTLPYTAPLARMYEDVDEVIALDTNRIRTVRGLLSPTTWRSYRQVYRALHGQVDLAISVYGQMASLVALLSGAGRVLGYQDEAFPRCLTDPIAGGRHSERMHEVEYVRRLAHAADAREFPDRLDLDVPEEARSAVRRLLTDAGIQDSDRVVILHAGSVNGSAKRWPVASWARFAQVLSSTAGVRVILAGSAGDRPIAEAVQQRSQTPLVSLVGQTDIGQLAALLERADLVVSGDSGPLHLAVALGRPLLGVYGPTDPAIYGPYLPQASYRLRRADLPCSPCYSLAATAECPLGDPICMRLVSVSSMVGDALDLLGLPRSEDQFAMAQ